MGVFDSPRTARQYLLKLEPWDPGAAATVALYAGTHAFVTGPADSPANAYFEPVVKTALRRRTDMYRPGRIGGRSIPSRGAIVLELPAALAHWRDYYWEGRTFTCWVGEVGAPWAAHEVLASGVCALRGGTRHELVLPVRDRQHLFDRPIRAASFAGSGSAEGGSDLAGKPKPLLLGLGKNITPVLIDRANQVYAINGGAINAVVAGMDRGIQLTAAGDVADLWATSVSTGTYKTNLANGLVRVGGTLADPVRDFTCTAQGDKTGGTWRTSAADLMQWIAESVVGLASGDLVAASFAALNTANSAVLGLWLPQGGRADETMDLLADSVGAWWTTDRLDRLAVGRFAAPSAGSDFALEERDFVRGSFDQIGTESPRWRQTVLYDRNWTVQTDQDLAAGTTYYDRDWLAAEWRHAVDDDPAIRTGFPDAGEDEIETALTAQAAAEAEATRRLALYGTRRDRYRGDVRARAFAFDLGDDGTIAHAGFSAFAGGGAARLVALDESARDGSAVIEVWR